MHQKTVIQDTQDEYDPSRLPPRIFLHRAEARASIEKEIRDLLEIPSDGIPPIKIANRQSNEVKGLPYVRSTLIVRIKSTGVYKSRLCLRGDLVNERVGSFSSSPTTHRSSLRLVISCVVILGLSLSLLGVSQAFLRSDALPPDSRCVVIVPEYIVLPAIKVDPALARNAPRSELVLLMNKPLYGSRTAPLRWWLKISQHMRQWGLRQHRLDICMHTWRSDGSTMGTSIDLLIILHVGDFLIGHSARGLAHFAAMMAAFKTGEVCTLSDLNPLTYLGINISLLKNGHIVVSQHEFINRLRAIDPNKFAQNGAKVLS